MVGAVGVGPVRTCGLADVVPESCVLKEEALVVAAGGAGRTVVPLPVASTAVEVAEHAQSGVVGLSEASQTRCIAGVVAQPVVVGRVTTETDIDCPCVVAAETGHVAEVGHDAELLRFPEGVGVGILEVELKDDVAREVVAEILHH